MLKRLIQPSKNYLRFLSAPQSAFDAESAKQILSSYEGGFVKCTQDNETGIADITIEHKSRKNAFTGSMMVQLNDVVTNLQSWHTGKAVTVRGADGFFCSGGDLNFMKQIKSDHKEYASVMSKFMQNTLQTLADLPMISVACIEGKAIGGGAEVAVSCDFILSSSNAQIQFPQKLMGVTTGWGGGVRLMKRVGVPKSLDILLSTESINAQNALACKLFDEVFQQSDFTALSGTWVQHRVQGDVAVIRNFKRLASLYRGHSLLDFEHLLFSSLVSSESAFQADLKNAK